MTTTAQQEITIQASPELKAQLEAVNAELAAVRTELTDVRKSARAEREEAIRTTVDAVISKMCGPNDTRFPKELLDNFKGAYLEAKLATLSENADVKALAAKMVEHLDKIASAQPPAAPGGEKEPGEPPAPPATALTKDDFMNAGTAEADAKIAKAIDAYVAEKNLTGPNASMVAFRALATAAGVPAYGSTPAPVSPGGGDDEDDE